MVMNSKQIIKKIRTKEFNIKSEISNKFLLKIDNYSFEMHKIVYQLPLFRKELIYRFCCFFGLEFLMRWQKLEKQHLLKVE